MATKKITTFTIGILALAISALFVVHYLRPSPPATGLPWPPQGYTIQAPQVAPYNTKVTLDTFFTNENIAKLIVGTFITFAIIGGFIIIYSKRFEASEAIAPQVPPSVVPNIEPTATPNKTVYNPPLFSELSTLSHHESAHTIGHSDHHAQNADSDYDTAYRSASPMPQSPKNTVSAAISPTLLPKDIHPYAQDMQGGDIQEHHWHKPTPAMKGYGAGGVVTMQINYDKENYLHLKPLPYKQLPLQYSTIPSPIDDPESQLDNSYTQDINLDKHHNPTKIAEKQLTSNHQKEEEAFGNHNRHISSTDHLSAHNGHSDPPQQHQAHTLDTTIHSSHKPDERTRQPSNREKKDEALLSGQQQPIEALNKIKISTEHLSSDYQTDTPANTPSLHPQTAQHTSEDLLSTQKSKKVKHKEKDFKHTLALLKHIVQGKALSKDTQFTHSDVLIFKQIVSQGLKTAPRSNVLKKWYTFTTNQEKLKIDMAHIYKGHQKFTLLGCAPNEEFKHVWLFNILLKAFPNATYLKCKNIDCIWWKQDSDVAIYSSSIVNENFIEDLATNLNPSQKSRWSHLDKITITTGKHQIGDDIDLKAMQFAASSWHIKKEDYKKKKNNQLTLTKEKGGQDKIWEEIVAQGLIPKISYLIGLRSSDESNLTTAAVMPIFTKLLAHNAAELPPHAVKAWNMFTESINKLTFDMANIDMPYQKLKNLFFSTDNESENVLLLATMVKTFPNLKTIECNHIDYRLFDKTKDKIYLVWIDSNFILGLLDKIASSQDSKLEKIMLTAETVNLQALAELHNAQFERLGWKVNREKNYTQIMLIKQKAYTH